MALNQLTVAIVEKRHVEKEPEVTVIPEIPDNTFPLDKGYYNGVHVLLYFHK